MSTLGDGERPLSSHERMKKADELEQDLANKLAADLRKPKGGWRARLLGFWLPPWSRGEKLGAASVVLGVVGLVLFFAV